MKTSYFGKLEWLINHGYTNFVAVSGYVPEFYQTLMDNHEHNSKLRFRRCKALAPKKEWFWKWKNGELNNDDYERLYEETVLDQVNYDEIVSFLGDDAVLICYEKPDVFCHRYLIAGWLEEHGIKCDEIESDQANLL